MARHTITIQPSTNKKKEKEDKWPTTQEREEMLAVFFFSFCKVEDLPAILSFFFHLMARQSLSASALPLLMKEKKEINGGKMRLTGVLK